MIAPALTAVGVVSAVVTAMVATGFAVRAWRQRLLIESTSVWDPVTSFVQFVIAIVLTYSLGGFAGAGWGLVLVLLPYFGVVFESTQLRLLAVGGGVAVLAAGVAAGTATAALVPLAGVVVAATTLGLWFTEQSATYMFEMRREAQRQREAVEVRVAEISEALLATAHGDLTVHASEGVEPAPSEVLLESEQQLRVLTESFNNTVGQRAGVGGADSWGW